MLIFRPAGGGGADGGDGALGGYRGDLGVTVINALIGHVLESNAEKSLQGIPQHALQQCPVQRNGKTRKPLPTWRSGAGVISLFCGRATAFRPDMRLIENSQPAWKKAILTGESTVVDKITDALQGRTCRWATGPT